MASKRFPGKVLVPFGGSTMLEFMIKRIKRSDKIDKIVIATTTNIEDDKIVTITKQSNCIVYRGSESDVLERFYFAALENSAKVIVRLTADDPFKTAEIIDCAISKLIEGSFDYVSNTIQPTFPEGLDVEVFTFAALETAHLNSQIPRHREHVTPYIWERDDSSFSIAQIYSPRDFSSWRMTIDYEHDYTCLKQLVDRVNNECNFEELVNAVQSFKVTCVMNPLNIRNEGYNEQLSD